MTPHNEKLVTTYISTHTKNLLLPTANVTVLSAEKTFWEKITLLHYECNRPKFKTNANRLSRHWYDMAMLADHEVAKKSLNNRELLNEVIQIKKTFFNSGFADYDGCLTGRLKLIPNPEALNLLQADFQKMTENKMFYNKKPNFHGIITKVKKLENILNFI